MQKTILYAVLNWGLGHATRSIPIIRFLKEQGHHVIIASDGVALQLLKKEFPALRHVQTEPYNVHYASAAKNFNVELALQIPKFIQAIKKEHKDCAFYCEKYDVDYIISDNRYGFYHQDIPSAFICHQLRLLYPENKLIEKIVNKSYQGYLAEFTQLWVPDIAPPKNISEEMSALKWRNVHYLGMSSRLTIIDQKKTYQTLSILSGPEPQRTMLEDELLSILQNKEGKHCLIRGTDLLEDLATENVDIINLATSDQVNELMNSSEVVICRSGYTSIMDLFKLRKKAILIPTPGQAEQEYLAHKLATKKWFQTSTQGAIDLQVDSSYQLPELDAGYDFTLVQDFLSY